MLIAVNEPYALMVQPDDILISPREVDEHFGTMVCFHPRYALGDHHNHMDKDDFLREMYLDTVGHDEAGMKRYERMVNIVSSRFRHGPKTEERAIDEAMQKVISEKYLMLPLYLYDHSGLAMSTESFSGRAPHAEWDSGQVGWIYVSKEDALKEFDADKMTGAIRQKADALMRSEVAAYDSYLPVCLPQADPSRKDGRRRTWIADRPLPHEVQKQREEALHRHGSIAVPVSNPE
jgi:hypothetical protein